MKFSCKKDTFATYLNIVNRIVISKPGLPILNNILIQAEKGKLFLKSTDLELGLNCWIGAKVDEDGIITVPSRQITEFVSALQSDNVEASLSDNVMTFSTENNTANFNTIPSDDYPTFASIDGKKPLIKISKDDILDAVNKIVFSTSKETFNPVLTGIKIEIEGDVISFVATDSLRLSRYSIKLSKKVTESLEFIVPAKAFEEIAYIISNIPNENGADFVEIYVIEEKNQIMFRYNDVDLVSRLIDGNFPNYKAIIPTTYSTKFTFDRQDFLNALKVINIIARQVTFYKVNLLIDVDEKKAILTSNQADLGSNESIFKISPEGKKIEISFNSKYLMDLLTHLGEDKISFEIGSANSPASFKVDGKENFFHLIMPMSS